MVALSIGYAQVSAEELPTFAPRVVHVDAHNRVVAVDDVLDALSVSG